MQLSRPLLIAHQGRLAWQFDDGTIRPYVGGGADGDDDKKFTQADMDRAIEARIARVKAEPPADYAQLKADSAELATLKAAAEAETAKNQSDAEATAARIAALEASVAASTEAVNAAKADALDEKKRSAFISDAAAAKIVNPAQAWSLLTKEQRDAVTIGDDGQVKGGKEVAAKFAEDNPHFVGTPARLQPDPAQGKRGDGTELGAAGKAEAAKRFGTPATAGAAAGQQ